MQLKNERLSDAAFFGQRDGVLGSWPTGTGIEIADGIARQQELPESKRFANALEEADRASRTLLQPRAGVALLDEHIRLLAFLEPECDLLPSTIDAYTRLNRYDEAQKGIEKSRAAGTSMLNGFPAVNYGVEGCRQVVESLDKPVEIRHGTPDARLLAEITYAAGFTSFEGGGISYNIPYAKSVSLEKSLADWQYVDRLTGMYEEAGVRINREPFGPLSGTLIPPFISHTVAIIEGLLALEQGVKSITLGYGQAGNLVQDIAAMASLRELAHEYFRAAGYGDYHLSTVLHQWMGGFPEDEARAFAVISWGGAVASMARATKVIVKTPHEASGIPTREANLEGLKCTRQIVNMLTDQVYPDTARVLEEVDLIKREVRCVMEAVRQLGSGDWAAGAVRAFEAGVLDVPFAPAQCNAGRLMPVRDNQGAVRIFDFGSVPFDRELKEIHQQFVAERAAIERREPSFQMVIDDIYAISKSTLVGRPR